MGGIKGQRIRLLYLADIFKKYTDEEHPLSAGDLIDMLSEKGIPVERKAIYGDISLLCEYGMDILKTRVPKSGYYLASREFETPEIYLLADAVQAADFISRKKSRELIEKLESMLSDNEAREIRSRVYIDSRNKCQNEEIFYSIDAATRAITENKKLTFKYTKRVLDEGGKITLSERQLKVSPFALVWADDHYYLVCNYEKYDNLMQLRLDRMKKAHVLDEPARDYREVSEYKNYFDVADYASKAFNMFGGEQSQVTLRCKSDKLEQILDRFGDKISVRNVENDTFTFKADALISEGLVNWIMEFGDAVEVLSPQHLRDSIKQRCEKIYSYYK
ncbi:MAG: WYL domain-containing protein [Clostridia bacterium]|nr:WYL domain-containing protein [Clostridia bacterium]